MRLSALACAGILALTTLTACGSDDDPGKVTSKDVRPALLTVDDLSAEFEVDPDDGSDDEDDDDDPAWGCLFDLDDLSKDTNGDDEDDDENQVQFRASQEPGMPGVIHFVEAAPSQARAEKLMDEVAEALEGCEKVDETEEDGTTWTFDVEFDRSAWARGADEQLNVAATGATTTDELELPISITMSAVRIENAVSILMFIDIAEDVAGAPRTLTNAASGRLQAVMDGDEVADPEPLLEDYPIGAGFADLLGSEDPA
jgi:hypothetical protein